MTLERFLEKLAGLKRKWYIDSYGRIRTMHETCFEMCPISAFGNRSAGQWKQAAREAGFNLPEEQQLMAAIVIAADGDDTFIKTCITADRIAVRKALRKKLLTACELS